MGRTTPIRPGRWTKAVKELVTASGVRLATVASEAGLVGPTLSRYLGLGLRDDAEGAPTRRPSEHAVLAVNAALARVLNEPRIAEYLDAEYWLDKSRESDQLPAGTFAPFPEAVLMGYGHLRYDARAEILKQLNFWPAQKRRSLILAVNAMHRRRLIRHILGDSDPSRSSFEEVRELCARHGWDMTRWLRPSDELGLLESEDEFFRAVRRGLSKIAKPADRFAAEQTIRKAFRKVNATRERLANLMMHKSKGAK